MNSPQMKTQRKEAFIIPQNRIVSKKLPVTDLLRNFLNQKNNSIFGKNIEEANSRSKFLKSFRPYVVLGSSIEKIVPLVRVEATETSPP